MIVWRYIIRIGKKRITTKNSKYAEKKRKLGYFVLCKRETNIHKPLSKTTD